MFLKNTLGAVIAGPPSVGETYTNLLIVPVGRPVIIASVD
jgi:hypothetical protein